MQVYVVSLTVTSPQLIVCQTVDPKYHHYLVLKEAAHEFLKQLLIDNLSGMHDQGEKYAIVQYEGYQVPVCPLPVLEEALIHRILCIFPETN
jgi:hypothetical protein